MKPVLILENQIPENIAYLGTWLRKNNIAYEVHNAERDRAFPTSMEPYCALAVMGGAMSANDPLPTNRQAEILILQAMYRDKPVIGHCLGGQLMARALGAKVQASPMPEIGWQKINYLEKSKWFGDDPLDTVIHWHYESFDIPSGAKLLASSESCPNQAFSIGKHLAMQFHIEIDENKIHYWVSGRDRKWKEARNNKYSSVQNKKEMLAGIKQYLQKHQIVADSVYKTWLTTTEWKQNG